MKNSMFMLVLASFALAGCSSKIDTSSPQAYSSSIAKLTKDMTEPQKVEFREALLAIIFGGGENAGGLFQSANLDSPIFIGAGDKINGKTAPEILKIGYETRVAALDTEIAEAVGSVQRANAERERYKSVFDNIHVDNARYYIDNSNSFMAQPTLGFRIVNGSKTPLKTIYLHGILTSPGRSIPWVSEDFNYEFNGGLEPGESQQLDLQPNMFGEWKADDRYATRPDLKLSLSLVNVEDASGKKLLEGDPGDAEVKQLEVAEKQKKRDEFKRKLSSL